MFAAKYGIVSKNRLVRLSSLIVLKITIVIVDDDISVVSLNRFADEGEALSFQRIVSIEKNAILTFSRSKPSSSCENQSSVLLMDHVNVFRILNRKVFTNQPAPVR